MQDVISTETSHTAMACEQAALFGTTPSPDEFDNREIWNEDEALAGIEEAIHILAGAVAPDGTQLADERESLLWGFVNALHAQVQRLDRGIDKIAPEMKDLQREQDGSEIKSCELERLTDRVQNLGDRRDAFETMRDLAAEGYRTETGDTWRPRNGSHSSQTGKLTSAAIDARDYLRARKDRETTAHLPEGTLVGFTGGKDFGDVTAIWRSLDSIHTLMWMLLRWSTPPTLELFDAPERRRLTVVSLLPNARSNAKGNSPASNGRSASADIASSISTAFIDHSISASRIRNRVWQSHCRAGAQAL